MSDLIRRADAIVAVENNSYGMGSRASVKAIKSLPSAEAEVYEDYEHATLVDIKAPLRESADAVPQSEQYKRGFEDAKRAFLVEYARESENMRKRIAKLEVMLNAQKAISAEADSDDLIIKGAKGIQDGLYNITGGKLFKYKAKGGIVQAYEIVPAADPVQGEWFYRWNDFECSACGVFEKNRSNFCPNCGTKMYKDGEDE